MTGWFNASASWRQGFGSLMATQFQNACSSLALKNLVIFLVLAQVAAGERDRMLLWRAGEGGEGATGFS